MNKRTFLVGSALLALPLLVTPFLAPAPAYAADTAAAQFGIVDLSRLLKDSKSQQQAADTLQRTQQNYMSILKRLDQGTSRFLTEAEINELEALYEKDTLTDADKKRVGDLEAKGDALKRELTTIQNTSQPTPVQSTRLQALGDMQEKGNSSLQKLVGTLDARFKDRARDADQKALTQIRGAVAKVAKARSLSAVFTTDVALYATTDITDDVLKELNK